MVVVSLVALVALLGAAGWTLTARRAAPGYLLLALAVLWLFANAGLEGPVLWSLDPRHGLVLADLLTPVCVLLALWRLRTVRRDRRRDLRGAGQVAGNGAGNGAGSGAANRVRVDRQR
ncbi:hypothetical protein [Nakamurella lactea]|uniref:hypothetical protein n=1 Tax=Nakamurella lactea TaxID=459515 RepID=UPI0004160D4F|nr:hypothetical protein [Nakamurella lactea]